MVDTLLVTPYYDPNIVGGAEISVQLIAEGLLGRCDVLTYGLENKSRTVGGVTVYEIHIPGFDNLWKGPLGVGAQTKKDHLTWHLKTTFPVKALVTLYADFFAQHTYKTVILNSNEDAMARPSLWKAAHASGARVVLTLRDDLLLSGRTLKGIDYSGAFRIKVRQQLDWIDEIVAPSQYMIDLYSKFGMVKKNSRVIPNAVSDLDVEVVPFSKKSGVLYAGSLSEQKGIPTLIMATGSFVTGENLTLIGRGPLAGSISNGKRVTKFDWMPKDDLYQVMAKVKVLILPSEWPEAFGRVLVEAVRCGTLVVGSDAGGIPEVLSFDERYIFPSGNATVLSERVNRILLLNEAEYAQELDEMQKKMTKFDLVHYVASWANVVK